MNQHKLVVTISGASCSGKTYLASHLKENALFEEAVSTTTRMCRAGEVNGKDYNFISREDFIAKKEKGDFIETVEFSGNFYGTSSDEFERMFDKGIVPLVVIEPNGAYNLHEHGQENGWTVLNVFIDAPVELSINRFCERYRHDMANNQGSTDSYINRILDLISTELHWKGAMEYDFIYPASNGLVELKAVADKITTSVLELNADGVDDYLGREKTLNLPGPMATSDNDHYKNIVSGLLSESAKPDGDIINHVSKITNMLSRGRPKRDLGFDI